MRKMMTAMVAAALAMPGLAMAQDTPAATTAPTVQTAPAGTASTAWYTGKRGDEIVGQDLYTADGTEIGEIDNVVISKDGKQAAAVLGVGGFLGLGEREVAIPLDEISMGAEDRLTTSMTKESIGALQPYADGGEWGMFDGTHILGQ